MSKSNRLATSFEQPNHADKLFPETLLRLSEAARLLPSLRKQPPGASKRNHPHYNTLRRWATKGVRARNGEKVKLEIRQIGHTTFTSVEALACFLAQLTHIEPASGHFPKPASDVALQTQADVALNILREQGICE